MINKVTLDSWINVPAIIKTEHGNVMGSIKYGVRIPLKPGTTPLHECPLGSKEEVENETPGYWFVGENNTPKVYMHLPFLVKKRKIIGIGKDQKLFFYTILRRKV